MQYHSMSKIGKCSVPFLFISGLADNLVPPRMMRALYTKCGSEIKRLLEFPGGSHNDTWIVDGYGRQLIFTFPFIHGCACFLGTIRPSVGFWPSCSSSRSSRRRRRATSGWSWSIKLLMYRPEYIKCSIDCVNTANGLILIHIHTHNINLYLTGF